MKKFTLALSFALAASSIDTAVAGQCGTKIIETACPGKVKTDRSGWGNGSRKNNDGSIRISGSSVSGTCTILAGPLADAALNAVPKYDKGSDDECADLCAKYPNSGFCSKSPTQDEMCGVTPFLSICPPDIDECGIKIVDTVCAGKVKTSNKGWGNGSRKNNDGSVRISGSGVSGTCTIRAGPIADAVFGVIPRYTPNPNDRRLQETEPVCADLCKMYPQSGFCGDAPTKDDICEAEPYLTVCPPKIDTCGVMIVDAVCEGKVKTSTKGWGNGSRRNSDGSLRISGSGVSGTCTIKAGPIADAVYKTIPKFTPNPNDRRLEEEESVCADLCTAFPDSGFCSDAPTEEEICEAEPFLTICPPPIDACGIAIVDTVCDGKVKTETKGWGNGSRKNADGSIRISGTGVSGTCTIKKGPIADAVYNVIPKFTSNPNDRRLEEALPVCADLCRAYPDSGFCGDAPTKDEICEAEPFLTVCPPPKDACGIKIVNTVCGDKVKTETKGWGNGSRKNSDGSLRITGAGVSGTCTIKEGPIADAVYGIIPKFTANPNDRRLEESKPVCEDLCTAYPDSGFCSDDPTEEEICEAEPFLTICPPPIDACGITIVDTVCAGKVKAETKGWGNGSRKNADGSIRISGSGVSGTCSIRAGAIADAVYNVIPKFTANPNDRRLEETKPVCEDLCKAFPGSGFCGKSPSKDEICEAEPYLTVCPPKIDQCGMKLIDTVCAGKVKTENKNWGNGSRKTDSGELVIRGGSVSGTCKVKPGPIADALYNVIPKFTPNPNDRRRLEETDVCDNLCAKYPDSGFCKDEPTKDVVCAAEPTQTVCPLSKQAKDNRKPDKAAQTGLDIIGGQCVADHVCATVRGDPHLVTFDGMKYDCQGHGEFVLAKSLQTAFEIQGRFVTTNRKSKSVSVTKAVSIDTGVEGAPQFDVFTDEADGECNLNYYVNGELADFGEDGKAIDGIDFMEGIRVGGRVVDYLYFTGSGVMYTALVRKGSFGCVMDSKICLPPKMVNEETIIGLLGTPNGNRKDDWMTKYGGDVKTGGGRKEAYDYCTREWCVHSPNDSIFGYQEGTEWADFYGCKDNYDPAAEQAIAAASQECIDCCAPLAGLDENEACLLECMEGNATDCQVEINADEVLADVEKKCPDTSSTLPPKEPQPEPTPEPEPVPAPVPEPTPEPVEPEPVPSPSIDDRSGFPAPPKKGSGSGDPHFKTWTGDKYDYHGECDLVLVHNPSFNNGQGLRVHIRTTRVKHFSFISNVAVQIGDDVLEFDNDVENFLINGLKAEANKKHHKTHLGGFIVRRDPKAISIRLHDVGATSRHSHTIAKIDLHTRKNGFPAVIVDGGETNVFEGSLGLLGDWATGKRVARDGETELNDTDATAFALEWQVRDTEPQLFMESRFPQFPTVCTPPVQQPKRLGMSSFQKEAEEACAHWKEDMEDCVFDVMATRDVLVAEEGHIVHVQ